MDAQEPASVLPGRTCLAPETGRICGVIDREVRGVEDLIAVDVGDGHLRGGNQVQVVALDGVHLPFLVRQLAGAAPGGGIDQQRRPQLQVACQLRHLEHEADEGALQPGAGAGVQDESAAGDLGAALQIEEPQALRDLPVRRCPVGGAWLAPGSDERVVVRTRSIRDRFVRQVGDQEHLPLE